MRDESGPPSAPPSSLRISLPPPPPEPSFYEFHVARTTRFLGEVGEIASLSVRSMRSILRRPFEIDSTLQQLESLGVKSMGIVTVTSIFIGMVMTIQFGFGLRRFGGVEYIPRVIILSFCRELAPTLTAVIVGGRTDAHVAANARIGTLRLTQADHAELDAVLDQRRGPAGDTYTLERDRSGRHGAIMKYNLNSAGA